MSDITPKISEKPMSGSAMPDVRQMLLEGAERPGLHRKQVIPMIAREVRVMSPRRVAAIIHGEARRFWWDEVEAVKAWHRNFLAAEAVRAEHRAAVLRARHEALEAEENP